MSNITDTVLHRKLWVGFVLTRRRLLRLSCLTPYPLVVSLQFRIQILYIIHYIIAVEKELGAWSQWGTCSKSCDTGVRVRTRDKVQTSLDDTDDTLTNQHEDTMECNTQGCPGKKLS